MGFFTGAGEGKTAGRGLPEITLFEVRLIFNYKSYKSRIAGGS
jgi:hypothetical protein